MCITTNQPDTKSVNLTILLTYYKQQAIMNIQLNIVTVAYPVKLMRDNVVASFVLYVRL